MSADTVNLFGSNNGFDDWMAESKEKMIKQPFSTATPWLGFDTEEIVEGEQPVDVPSPQQLNTQEGFRQNHPKLFKTLMITAIILGILAVAALVTYVSVHYTVGWHTAWDKTATFFSKLTPQQGLLYFGAPTGGLVLTLAGIKAIQLAIHKYNHNKKTD